MNVRRSLAQCGVAMLVLSLLLLMANEVAVGYVFDKLGISVSGRILCKEVLFWSGCACFGVGLALLLFGLVASLLRKSHSKEVG